MIGSVKQDVNAVLKEIERFVLHPKFEFHFQFGKNDIALVKLKEPIAEYTDFIRPACLPQSKTQTFDNRVCYATGFGRMNRRRREGRFLSIDQSRNIRRKLWVLNFCMHDSMPSSFASTHRNKNYDSQRWAGIDNTVRRTDLRFSTAAFLSCFKNVPVSGPEIPGVLLETRMKIRPNDNCISDMLNQQYPTAFYPDQMLCAGSFEGLSGACNVRILYLLVRQ